MIYLDYNATTPIDKRVTKAMEPYIYDIYGNPSSSHELGKKAAKAVKKARSQVAKLLGANSEEIIFTSGGSESNNTVIKGVAETYQDQGNHIITSQIEHPAVINACKYLEKKGFQITYLPVDKYGMVDVEDVRKAITDKTILITIMHANNEVGTIQPLKEISEIAHKNEVLVHTDAAQSVGKIPTKVNELGVDFLSVAGHKLYAPKGIGALYIREGIEIEPLIHGGGQEFGKRAGTENVIFAVGLGEACEVVNNNKLRKLTDYFYDSLVNEFKDSIILNGHPEKRLPNTLNVSFKGMDGLEVLNQLDDIAASTGSACHSGKKEPSRILKAMDIDNQIAMGAVRFSLGRYTTKEDIDKVMEQLTNCIKFD
ncbi:cysteine desulfurase family protein [Halobacteroides halobius DSM 5150]|uniref:cysteine desulfurase n=1 Tax=Halobacteroides halobius (strain ATCC 35273 / DSM 5150 / MD-1) TaxID=748449 RepID=L0K5A1_HALHC|nr:cysteine desulfurase family protein [Halobacteroides halobius]AGB40447.1 cysteine desulfurase family protein [Halobacteroides halobius DSM 5150]